LQGIILHGGANASVGHYVYYFRPDITKNGWICYNDFSVTDKTWGGGGSNDILANTDTEWTGTSLQTDGYIFLYRRTDLTNTVNKADIKLIHDTEYSMNSINTRIDADPIYKTLSAENIMKFKAIVGNDKRTFNNIIFKDTMKHKIVGLFNSAKITDSLLYGTDLSINFENLLRTPGGSRFNRTRKRTTRTKASRRRR
jgi:hypothetical protein